MSAPSHDSPQHALILALAGAPNVGKSTLMNRILGRTLSIATHKPQTTRTRVLGVHVIDNTQLVFTDTPGIHEGGGPLIERMVHAARAEVRGADLTCWLLAADNGVTPTDREELVVLRERPLVLVMNKVDLVARERLLPLLDELSRIAPEQLKQNQRRQPSGCTRREPVDHRSPLRNNGGRIERAKQPEHGQPTTAGWPTLGIAR